MKYYKACRGVLTYAVGTDFQKIKNFAESRGILVKETTKANYMLCCLSFRPEQIYN